MCILIHKPKNVGFPKEDYFLNCFENNPDGIGISWVDNAGISHIKKGFMRFNKFMKFLSNNPELSGFDCLIHFRYATHGSIVSGNCHPFPVSMRISDLKKTNISGNFQIMAHNGIISELSDIVRCYHKDDLSDTMVFAKMLKSDGLKMKYIRDILESGKFCLQDSSGTTRYGKFIEDMGLFWSNATYKDNLWSLPKKTNKSSSFGFKNTWHYDIWDLNPEKFENPKNESISEGIESLIMESDLDRSGVCIHEKQCRKNHECFICGLSIPEIQNSVEYQDICPMLLYMKDKYLYY